MRRGKKRSKSGNDNHKKSDNNAKKASHDTNRNRLKSFLVLVVGTIFISCAQLLIKIGSGKFSLSIDGLIFNHPLIFGFACYALSMLIMIYSLKTLELSVAYPVVSLSFVRVSLLSIFFLKETPSLTSFVGIPLIMLGVSIIGFGGKK